MVVCEGLWGDGVVQPKWDVGAGYKMWGGHLQ